MTSDKRVEKIYLTYKTRMLSAALAKSHARFYNALIPWYSFILIAFSIAQGFGYLGEETNLLFAVASVGIFGLSLYINGHQLWQREDDYKTCYLELTQIYESTQSADEKMAAYHKVLAHYENQTDSDYDEMVFDAWFRNQSLENSKGVVKPTFSIGTKVILQKFGRIITRIGLIIAPFFLVWIAQAIPEKIKGDQEREIVGESGEPTPSST